MTVCSFFLQGRCRYGDKCWNEHPRDGRGGGEYRGNQQQPSRGGYGNRVWINPAQRGGGEFIQPSSFSRGGNDGSRGGGNDWGRGGGNDRSRGGGNDWSRGGGGGGNDWGRGSGNDGSRGGGNDWGRGGGMSRDFSSQNRFSALSSQSSFDTAGQNAADDNAKHVETIQSDMEVWQTSGQWPFSCYSVLNKQISGFVEWSPEELRQEYYTYRASGDIQPYVNSVQLLANQWSNRVQELRTMSRPTQISVISELNNSSPQTPSHGLGSSSIQGFGSTVSGFGATSSSTTSGFGAGGFGSGTQSINSFSFAQSKTDFGAAPDFGGAAFSPAQTAPGFSSPAPSATSFSFAAPAADNQSSSAAGFSFKTSSAGLGSGFGSSAPPASGGFGQSSAVFTGAAQAAGNSGGSLFTAQSDLSAEELKEFTARRFTLGQIPLKPPPADLLMV
ncbi:hypothetical protein ABG768_012387 [Culter alburnus]|uniref:Nucleoporin NUP42 n=1 Tax=Culter alburnus TaxID=194366 RepID=A0AAW1ZBE9_CULAL